MSTHSNYLRFAERARTEMLRQKGFDHGALLTKGRMKLAGTPLRSRIPEGPPGLMTFWKSEHGRSGYREPACGSSRGCIGRMKLLVDMRLRVVCVRPDGRPGAGARGPAFGIHHREGPVDGGTTVREQAGKWNHEQLNRSPWGAPLFTTCQSGGCSSRADTIVKLVMISLIIASGWCWAIIFEKTYKLRTLQRRASQFEETFWSGDSLDELFTRIAGPANRSDGFDLFGRDARMAPGGNGLNWRSGIPERVRKNRKGPCRSPSTGSWTRLSAT